MCHFHLAFRLASDRIQCNIPHLHRNSRSPSRTGHRHWTQRRGPGSCLCTPGWTREGTRADRAGTCPAAANPPAQTHTGMSTCTDQRDSKLHTRTNIYFEIYLWYLAESHNVYFELTFQILCYLCSDIVMVLVSTEKFRTREPNIFGHQRRILIPTEHF